MDRETLVYTAAQAAAAIGVGENKIYELIAGGHIPAIKWSERSIVIPKRALEQFLVDEAFRQQRQRQGLDNATSLDGARGRLQAPHAGSPRSGR